MKEIFNKFLLTKKKTTSKIMENFGEKSKMMFDQKIKPDMINKNKSN